MNKGNNTLRSPDERNILQFSSFMGLDEGVQPASQRFCRVITDISGSKGPRRFLRMQSSEISKRGSADSQDQGIETPLSAGEGEDEPQDILQYPKSAIDVVALRKKLRSNLVKRPGPQEKVRPTALGNETFDPSSPQISALSPKDKIGVELTTNESAPDVVYDDKSVSERVQSRSGSQLDQERSCKRSTPVELSTKLNMKDSDSSSSKGLQDRSRAAPGKLYKSRTHRRNAAKDLGAPKSWHRLNFNFSDDGALNDLSVTSRKGRSKSMRAILVTEKVEPSVDAKRDARIDSKQPPTPDNCCTTRQAVSVSNVPEQQEGVTIPRRRGSLARGLLTRLKGAGNNASTRSMKNEAQKSKREAGYLTSEPIETNNPGQNISLARVERKSQDSTTSGSSDKPSPNNIDWSRDEIQPFQRPKLKGLRNQECEKSFEDFAAKTAGIEQLLDIMAAFDGAK